jgi:hypothetical protein
VLGVFVVRASDLLFALDLGRFALNFALLLSQSALPFTCLFAQSLFQETSSLRSALQLSALRGQKRLIFATIRTNERDRE